MKTPKQINEACETERVVVTQRSCGLGYMQVCCVHDATDEEILKVCNTENPNGTTGGWRNVVRDAAKEDLPEKCGPIQCSEFPDRVHYLVSC